MSYLPSVKTLRQIAGDRAKELRAILELQDKHEVRDLATSGTYPQTAKWVSQCYNCPSTNDLKLSIADEILGTFGVEGIPEGSGSRSPSIEYCNTGETYDATLLLIDGHQFRVGNWGDIVERGNYD